MGGLIAQKLAESGLARAVALFAPSAPAGVPRAVAAAPLFTFANVLFRPSLSRSPIRLWSRGLEWGFLNRVPRERRDRISEATRYDSGRVLCAAVMPERDPRRTAHVDERRVAAPVLVLAGAKDRAVPVALHRGTAAKYARCGGDYVEYGDGAHWLIDEEGTGRVIADVDAWLRGKLA
jgi:alpha-beta hydrolase superfamily lysophospholipase